MAEDRFINNLCYILIGKMGKQRERKQRELSLRELRLLDYALDVYGEEMMRYCFKRLPWYRTPERQGNLLQNAKDHFDKPYRPSLGRGFVDASCPCADELQAVV